MTQGFKMAWKSILSNKLRSFLTMLGIIIGVSAVIALVSLGQGSTAQIKQRVESLGSNLLTVRIFGRGTTNSLTYNEAIAFAQKPGVKAVAPEVSGNVTAKNGNLNESVSLDGVTPEYASVRNYSVQPGGRFIVPIDIQYRQKVVVIGTQTAQNLYGKENPVGKQIILNGDMFQIIGELNSIGSSLGGSNDDVLLVPLTSAERLLRSTGIRNMYVQADTPQDVNSVMSALDATLKKIFPATATSQSNSRRFDQPYRIFNQQDALNTVSSVTKTTTLMLGGIAGISLLVGGIGIMNIMLVSVSERTREIGIRKAIGAKRKDILTQFLIESMVLGGIGGLIGVGLGVGAAELLSKFMKMGLVMSFDVVVIAFAFSLCIGVLFGLLPANKASKLRPIDALRNE